MPTDTPTPTLVIWPTPTPRAAPGPAPVDLDLSDVPEVIATEGVAWWNELNRDGFMDLFIGATVVMCVLIGFAVIMRRVQNL